MANENRKEWIEKTAKAWALGDYLSGIDGSEDFDTIVENLENNKFDDITVWQPFEDYDGQGLAEVLTDAAYGNRIKIEEVLKYAEQM